MGTRVMFGNQRLVKILMQAKLKILLQISLKRRLILTVYAFGRDTF
jgi:hypothetical protein